MDVNRVLKGIGLEPKRFPEPKEWSSTHYLLTCNFIYDTIIQNYCKLNVNLFIELLKIFILFIINFIIIAFFFPSQ